MSDKEKVIEYIQKEYPNHIYDINTERWVLTDDLNDGHVWFEKWEVK